MGDENEPRLMSRIAGIMSGVAAILVAGLGLKSAVTAWWTPSAEASAPAANAADTEDANGADANAADAADNAADASAGNAADNSADAAEDSDTDSDSAPAPAADLTR